MPVHFNLGSCVESILNHHMLLIYNPCYFDPIYYCILQVCEPFVLAPKCFNSFMCDTTSAVQIGETFEKSNDQSQWVRWELLYIQIHLTVFHTLIYSRYMWFYFHIV